MINHKTDFLVVCISSERIQFFIVKNINILFEKRHNNQKKSLIHIC